MNTKSLRDGIIFVFFNYFSHIHYVTPNKTVICFAYNHLKPNYYRVRAHEVREISLPNDCNQILLLFMKNRKRETKNSPLLDNVSVYNILMINIKIINF